MTTNEKTFLALLDDFFTWVYTDRIRDLFGKARLDQLRMQERRIRARLDEEFKVLVLGDFKRGKSTLVNALLGSPLVTMNVTPETITINEIGYGSELHAEAVMVDGARVILELDDIASEQLQGMMSSWAEAYSGETSYPSALTPDRLHQFELALIEAFNQNDLRLIVRHTIGRELDEITIGENLEVIVSDLVTRARKRGWLTQLVENATAEAPTNNLLQTFSSWYITAIKPSENDLIDDIPPNLYQRLSRYLLASDAFSTQDAFVHLCGDPRLAPWQGRLPEAYSAQQRVENTIHTLYNQFTKNQENALVILLELLAEQSVEQSIVLRQLAQDLVKAQNHIRSVRRHQRSTSGGFLQELAQEQALHTLPEGIENVSHLQITAPISWLKDVKLVDTPGIGDLANRFDALIKNHIPQADAIIFVTSAQYPLSQTERTFLQLSLAPRQFSKILFVLNKMDLYRTESDAQRSFVNVEANTQKIFPQANLFGVSAYDELCRLQGSKRPSSARAMQLQHDFQSLRDAINHLLLNRKILQIERTLSETTLLLNEIDTYVTQLEYAITFKYERLHALISQCNEPDSDLYQRVGVLREETTAQIALMKTALVAWIDDLLERFAAETVPSLGYVPYTEIQRHFLFFVIDKLTVALRACFDAQQPDILALMQKIDKAIGAELQCLREEISLSVEFSAEDQHTWAYLDAYDSLTNQGLTTVYNLVDRFLLIAKHMMKGKATLSDNRRRRQYQSNLLEALPDFRRSFHDELEQLYAQLTQIIDKQINDTSSLLFRDFGAVMQRAAELQGADAENLVERQETLRQLRQYLEETRTALLTLQEAVQPELVGV